METDTNDFHVDPSDRTERTNVASPVPGSLTTVTDADVDDLAALRVAVERALPAGLRSALRHDRHGMDDLVDEVITDACASFQRGGRSFGSWCAYLAAHRGWDLHRKLLGVADLRDVPMLVLDTGPSEDPKIEPVAPPLAAGPVEWGTALLDRLRPQLTDRQYNVVMLLAHGRSLAEAARELGLSREALNYQKKRITAIITCPADPRGDVAA